MIVIVMGVSGCGKTTIGGMLGKKLELPFYDADDFHSQESINKMAANKPLEDEDRLPWLDALANHMIVWQNAVLACSALKESYRQRLSSKVQDVEWVYLHGSKEVILQRMKLRQGHYMKAEMLDSQFASLEPPTYGYHVSIEDSSEEIISQLVKRFSNAQD